MDTQEFLRLVLPRRGLKIIALPHEYTDSEGKKKQGWRYSTYQSVEAMAEAAIQMDRDGKTVYFAVNGYGDWYTDEETGKKRIRTQDNVVACRSLYDDFDVDPDNAGKYESRESALADIVRLATELRMTPTVTSSGGGFHCYFSLDSDISADEWVRLSKMKRDITAHLGLKVDRAVDMDSARILRPIGTHNRKTDTPRPVEAIRIGKLYERGTLGSKLSGYIEVNHVAPAPMAKPKGRNPFAAALGDYPPSSAIRIVEHCDALRTVAEAKGNVDEPVWRAMLGLVKHCTEGDALCHEWSSGFAAYDQAETQDKIDHWSAGPTTCAEFNKYLGCIAGCPHAERVKSPIRLGYEVDSPSIAETPQAPELPPGITIDKEHIPYWPSGYRWNGSVLTKALMNDGVIEWYPICHTVMYPVRRIRVEDGTWSLLLRARETNGDWREFRVPTADLASPDTLAKSLGQYEVFVPNLKFSKLYMTDWLKDYTLGLQQQRISATTIQRFGWETDREGFALGNQIIMPGDDKHVICGETIPENWRLEFAASGTLEDWVTMTDRIANRPGAEVIQFALCHSFGAPLVWFSGDDRWHGIPFGMVGPSGSGKSTIAALACSIFANPDLLTSPGSSTKMSIIRRLASLNGVPYLLDELSNREAKELTDIIYAAGNGQERERLTNQGKFATVATPWYTNSFATSNDSLYAMLAQNSNEHIVDGTQLRVFETELPKHYINLLLSKDLSRADVVDHLHDNYGHAGRVFLKFVMANTEWVKTQLRKARIKYNPKSTEETKERFYLDAISTAVVAGKIAQRLGLIKFDLGDMIKWAHNNTLSLRENRKVNRIDASEQLASFISSLQGRMIVTKNIKDGRSEASEQPIEALRHNAVGRIAVESRKMYLHCKAVADWCKEHNVQPSALRKKMDEIGLLIYSDKNEPSHVMRIGAGSTVASTPARCYELNYNLLLGTGSSLHLVNAAATPVKEKQS